MTIQNLKQRKLGNKGFSLVELIIVIAIMAILIAVLAPMFIRYVERSRISTDINAIGSMGQALKTAAIDPANAVQAGGVPPTISVVWTTNGDVNVSGHSVYQSAVRDVVGSNVQKRSAVVTPATVSIVMASTDVGAIQAGATSVGGTAGNQQYFSDLLAGIN